jgi:hypothetical protein
MSFLASLCLVSYVLSSALHIKVNLPHPLTFGLAHCICDQLLDPMETNILCCSMVRNKLHPMTLFQMPLPIVWKKWSFMFHMNKLMSFCYLPSNFFVNGLTSCYWLLTFAPMLSMLIPLEHIWFCMLLHLMWWLWWWWPRQRKDLLWLTLGEYISSPCHRGFWLLTPTSGWFFSLMC